MITCSSRTSGAVRLLSLLFIIWATQGWGAPAVLVQPVTSQVVAVDAPVDFNVSAEGNGALNYQWFQNGRPLAGETGSRLTLGKVRYSDRGYYQVRLTDSTGSQTSHAGFLNVLVPAEIIPFAQDYSAPVPPGLLNVVAMDVGADHKLASAAINGVALKSDGTVISWGESVGAAPLGVKDVVAVSAGIYHSLALRSDGTVVAWGSNPILTTVPANLSGVVAISAGSAYNLALKENGTVIAWGANAVNDMTVPAGLSDVTAISAGQLHALALKSDGTVVTWGSSGVSSLTVPAGLTGVTAISAGYLYSLALKTDGTVVGWGESGYNDLSAPSGLSEVVAISAGDGCNLALKSDETAVAWGGNTIAEHRGVVAVAAGFTRNFALKKVVQPLITTQPLPAVQTLNEPDRLTYSVTATGGGLNYQWKKDGVTLAGETSDSLLIQELSSYNAGNYTVTVSNAVGSVTSDMAVLLLRGPTFIRDPEPSQVAKVGTSVTFNAAVTGSGSLAYQWMRNGFPIAGATGSSLTLSQARFSDRGYYQLRVTDLLGTATSRAGFLNIARSGELRVWGYNAEGQNTPPAGLTDIVALSASDNHTLALKSDGTVVAWGDDDVQVPSGLSGVVAVSCESCNVALKSDGTIVAWGKDKYSRNALFAGLSEIVAISDHFAIKADGTVVAWAFEGDFKRSLHEGLGHTTAITTGGGRVVTLRSDGSVVDWNSDGSPENSPPAFQTGVVAVASGGSHCLALKSDGTVVAWGNRLFTAVPVGLSEVTAISAGAFHSVALKSDGTVVAWGSNDSFLYSNSNQSIVPADLGYVVLIEAGSAYNLALQVLVPTPITNPATNLQSHSATFNAEINPEGFPASLFFQFSADSLSYENSTPPQQVDGAVFPVAVSFIKAGLLTDTTYHYRAVTTNGRTTSYGTDRTFTTLPPPPSTSGTSAKQVTTGSAILSGLINSNGIAVSAYFEYGPISAPAAQTAPQEFGPGSTTVTQLLSGLEAEHIYRFRLVATSDAGTTYGDFHTFSTISKARPTVKTGTVSEVAPGNAILGAQVNPNGFLTTVYFEYGVTANYGSETAVQNIGVGHDDVVLNRKITDFASNHLIHFRVVASNINGISYGDDQTFTSSITKPIVAGGSVSPINASNITFQSFCIPNGSATKAHFIYSFGTDEPLATAEQEIGSGYERLPVFATITVPDPARSCRYQLVATNAAGTVYGDTHTFEPKIFAVADTASINGAGSIRIDVLANDFSPAGHALSVSAVAQGSSGTVSINSDQSLQYLPGRKFTGSDSFIYTISDGHGASADAMVEIHNVPVKSGGRYVGLVLSEPLLHGQSGYINATLTTKGTLTGQLQFAGANYVLKGVVSSEGKYAQIIQRPHLNPLFLSLSTGSDAALLSGFISESEAAGNRASIVAKKSSFTKAAPCRLPGIYTALLQPDESAEKSEEPRTSGYATIQINALGIARTVGRLGDGTPISVGSLVCDEMELAFYTGLYGKKPNERGSLFGNVRFELISDIQQATGALSWHKPPQSSGAFYRDGFTVTTTLTGSMYWPTSPALTLVGEQYNAYATFTDGNLDKSSLEAELTKTLSISVAYKVTALTKSDDRLAVRISPKSGLFSGNFRDKFSGMTRTFTGVLLQNDNIGIGLFSGSNEMGSVRLQPRQN
ncbi:MAG: hypothetical protein JWL59_1235 [Chthoniobacteraceae bacterium]|nr:hypothetical protein [Chthoniobacteraceae bacterium]